MAFVRTHLVALIAGLLRVAAGLRNFFLPGFLSLGVHPSTDGRSDIICGSVLILAVLAGAFVKRFTGSR